MIVRLVLFVERHTSDGLIATVYLSVYLLPLEFGWCVVAIGLVGEQHTESYHVYRCFKLAAEIRA